MGKLLLLITFVLFGGMSAGIYYSYKHANQPYSWEPNGDQATKTLNKIPIMTMECEEFSEYFCRKYRIDRIIFVDQICDLQHISLR